MNLPEKTPDRDTIQQVIGILGAGWTVDQIIERGAFDSYAGAVLIFSDYLDSMEEEFDFPHPQAEEEVEIPTCQLWSWKRACRSVEIDPDGAMTSDTRRALVLAALLIEAHEQPPVTMGDLVTKAVEEVVGGLHNRSYWPGTKTIAMDVLEKLRKQDQRIADFLKQEVNDE
jgi:hypothetical protein